MSTIANIEFRALLHLLNYRTLEIMVVTSLLCCSNKAYKGSTIFLAGSQKTHIGWNLFVL